MIKINKINLGVLLLSLAVFSACNFTTNDNDGNDGNDGNGDNENPENYSGINETDFPLKISDNFKLSVFAENLSGVRVISNPDTFGNRWVSRTSAGIITQLEIDDQGKVVRASDILRNLNAPHSVIIDPDNSTLLYFAESDKVSRVPLYSDGSPEVLVELPEGGRHFTRSLNLGEDGRLYVSIGSSCDVCIESDERRASIYVMDKDGSNFEKFADGLRNSVFMTNHPGTGELWATDMGSDNLGDDLPPDEINIVEEGKNYGWPFCYGNKLVNENFNQPLPNENYCDETEPAYVELPAHSAPLGLAFVPEEGWPEEMANHLLVAFHGTTQGDTLRGYKIVEIELDDQGKYVRTEDFISGWLTEDDDVLGRPVDIVLTTDGTGFISDDDAGIIYQLQYLPNE